MSQHPLESPAIVESLWEEYAEVDVADVVVDIEAPDLQPTYTYLVPEPLRNALPPGICAHIAFAGRDTLGYVMARRKLSRSDPLCPRLKPILGVVEDAVTINAEQLHLVRWMRERYLCDLLSAIRCVAPASLGSQVATKARLAHPELRGRDLRNSVAQAHLIETLRALGGEAELEAFRKTANLPGFAAAYAALIKKGLLIETRSVERAKTVEKKMRAYALGPAAEVLSSAGSRRRSPQQQRLLNELLRRTRQGEIPVPSDELLRAADASAASLRGLVEKGLVVWTEIAVRRAPLAVPGAGAAAPPLTAGQRQAVEVLRACLDSGTTQTVLLFGVTASGKTEVYLNAIARALELGRSAMVLVPEIALTAQVADVFIGRFGEKVAILHSRLSDGEKHDEWRRMQSGEARIVVGARSAVFAPLQNLGLIVLDEEHEASYKQEKEPRYNARDLAAERARLNGATLVLGSATPSLESYFASEAIRVVGAETRGERAQILGGSGNQDGSRLDAPPAILPNAPRRAPNPSILRVEMRERIGNRPLPRVEVVDLREEFKERRALFSLRLTEAMAERLRRGEQTILFLNRRGYAQFVLCRDCGFVARCPNCAVSLAFHAYERALRCHHCDHTAPAPSLCPDCGSAKVRAFGIGTEKVEEEVLKIFPSARVARMDRDTTARKGAHTRIVRDFRQGEADILIGTQMVAKGLDFPNVTLVGVVSADTAINMPDFRAAERAFQLLTQVAGRAGRGEQPGEVIVQTFSPDHYAVQAAARQDYPAFYRQEILFRQELRYPPFSRFVNMVSADAVEEQAEARAQKLTAVLERILPPEIEIIGPSPAPLARLKNLYRFHVALRAPLDAPLSELVRRALEQLTSSDRLGLQIDLDPLSMA